MGIFDFFSGEKREQKRKQKLAEMYGFANYEDYIKAQNKQKKKVSKKGVVKKNKVDDSILKVNWDETEDIGIITHYKGEPFTGICFRLHENGKISEEVEMLKGLKHGTGRNYDEEGNLFLKIAYVKDNIDKKGIIKSYYPDGTLLKERFNFNGDQSDYFNNCFIREYHESGNLFNEGKYVSGKKNGVFNYYFDNKNKDLHSKITFEDDIENGVQKYYWENGKKRREGNVKNGKEDGHWKMYNKNGELLGSTDGNNFEIKTEKTKIMSTKDTDNNIKTNEIIKYYDSGEIQIKMIPSKFSNLKDDTPDGEYTEYYKNGNIKKEYTLESGYLYYDYSEYYENGQLKKKCYYDLGNLIDEYETFFENGNPHIIGDYCSIEDDDGNLIDNVKRCEWQIYYENGQIKEKGTYDDFGNKEDDWEYFLKNGEVDKNYEEKTEEISDEMNDYRNKIIENLKNVLGSENVKIKGDVKDNLEISVNKKNIEDGLHKKYYENGQIEAQAEYKFGKMNGQSYYYFESGELQSEGKFTDDKREGVWKGYHKNGKLRKLAEFNNGEMLSEENWDENGNKIEQ